MGGAGGSRIRLASGWGAARRVAAGEHYAAVVRDVGCSPASVWRWAAAYERKGIGGLMPDDDDARVPAVDDGCEDPVYFVKLRWTCSALNLDTVGVQLEHRR
ncbi:helix-turn-helix domain-containing protein, partial [Bifidobacterium pseudocatenulatum]|uniref:helix-turn-helix domain-containing protein n=1 Tax=Bifidobacterium pseudocatenulatum TaxID=28026 RepID=UPI003A5D09D8